MKKTEIKRQIKQLLEQLATLEDLPDDEFADGDVIQFKRRFPGTDTEYTYVAVRINGAWWSSGRFGSASGFTTWDQLCDVFASGQVTELWAATAWEEIPLP